MWKGDKQRRRELGRMKGKGLLVKAVSGGGDRLSSYRAPGPSVTDRSQNLHSIKARETKARRGAIGAESFCHWPGKRAQGVGRAVQIRGLLLLVRHMHK